MKILGFETIDRAKIQGILAGYFATSPLIAKMLPDTISQSYSGLWAQGLAISSILILHNFKAKVLPTVMTMVAIATHYLFFNNSSPLITGAATTAFSGAIGLMLNQSIFFKPENLLHQNAFLPLLAAASFFITGAISHFSDENMYFDSPAFIGNVAALFAVSLAQKATAERPNILPAI